MTKPLQAWDIIHVFFFVCFTELPLWSLCPVYFVAKSRVQLVEIVRGPPLKNGDVQHWSNEFHGNTPNFGWFIMEKNDPTSSKIIEHTLW